jgi:3-deoxy-D-manno-octulosonate 8-phosphate phosphatase (KDO 8-P phosphatase)
LASKGTLRQRLSRIRLLAMDVDGVLSDGRVIYDDRGRELKCFHAHDGYGMRRAIGLGLRLAIITGRSSPVVARRAKELGVTEVHQGIEDKLAVYRSLKRRFRLTDDEICYIGDDAPDRPVLDAAGVSAAPADAQGEVRDSVDIVTGKKGGRGAVRELLDAILRAKHLL